MCPQRMITGIAGALTIVTGAVFITIFNLLYPSDSFGQPAYTGLAVIAFLVMAAIEIGRFKAHRRQFDFSTQRRLSGSDHWSVFVRFAALVVTLALAWMTYAVLEEYGLSITNRLHPHFVAQWYRPFFHFLVMATALLLVCALPYFYVCVLYGRWDRQDDELLALWDGYIALIRRQKTSRRFVAGIRSVLVKFYFVPVMTGFLVYESQFFDHAMRQSMGAPWRWNVATFGHCFDLVYGCVFIVDCMLGLIGYVVCFRILDTNVRSTESTLLGWVVTLVCYPPFNHRLTAVYIPHSTTPHSWGTAFLHVPWLYTFVGALILLLLGVYVYATIAFGLRFSNLTHRGVLSGGPYAIVRHPAYAAKNVAWWLLSVPFLSNIGDCVRLALFNLIYILRAITEERHLSRDPVYREYMKRVKYRFIPGVF